MIRKILYFFALIFACFSLFSCYGSWNFFYEGNDVDYRTEKLTDLSLDADFAASGIANLGTSGSTSYTVLVITDTHFGYALTDFPYSKIYAYLDRLKAANNLPKFALSLGDSTDVGSQSEFDEYDSFCRKLKTEYNIPLIFNAAGNHDLYQGHWDNWKSHCWPHTSFYKFQTNGFSWYCLDTASGTLGKSQYEKFVNALKNDSNPKIVFSHYPFSYYNLAFGLGDTTERNLLLYQFAKNNVKCCLGGHNHSYNYDYLGFHSYALASARFNEAWYLLKIDEAAGTAVVERVN